MDIKKNKKAQALIALVIFIAIIAFFYLGSDSGEINLTRPDYPSIETDSAIVENIHLTKREPGGGDEEITRFKPNDYIELKGFFSLDRRVEIEFHLLDDQGEIIEERFLPTITDYEVVHYYSEEEEVSRCCGRAPEEEGDYSVGVFVGHPDTENEKAGTLDFEVEK